MSADFTQEELEVLEGYRTNTASVSDPAKFHIFEDPLCIVIGSAALEKTRSTWVGANDRKTFNQPVAFFPVEGEEPVEEAASSSSGGDGDGWPGSEIE